MSITREALEGTPVLTVENVTFDCADPRRLAEFWSEATGYQIEQQSEHMVTLSPGKGGRPNLIFMKVPEPRTVKNRVHLDVGVSDVDAEAARLIESAPSAARRTASTASCGPSWPTRRATSSASLDRGPAG